MAELILKPGATAERNQGWHLVTACWGKGGEQKNLCSDRLLPVCFPRKRLLPGQEDTRVHCLDCYLFFQMNRSKCLTPFITGLMGVMEKIPVGSRHELAPGHGFHLKV